MRPFAFQSSSMVEHAAVNRVVEGSSPSSGANFTSHWWTMTASSGRPQKIRECVVKCVVTDVCEGYPITTRKEISHNSPTAR